MTEETGKMVDKLLEFSIDSKRMENAILSCGFAAISVAINTGLQEIAGTIKEIARRSDR